MHKSFSAQDSSLKLLRFGERGMITSIHTLRDATAQALRSMGLTPGRTITLEQRFPRFIVRIGNTCHALDETAINAIYVRVIQHSTLSH
ncbi:ferrous iron transport protein A [Leptolyngbya sp. NK1-12]|uniref:Ferrous iron transport protein A n=1 Tax=Leptolyngbya sp. NK1-12 TaxID=2547451 RepID=A0AA97AIQ6_9CYAN|nr:FeoA family protein [Leptolyngbya sp. NK1-12]MBF2051586.1 ferrous iron transport protein A [Elainella sp. C42_A2020_010]RNJ66735.1 MAG: ferrous iron transport protein A [Leptolyngbya sp. IPPAS B-1204]WNZ26940.1 ferrous iron transport protein A [Leptolyngbya sp. NK1-12]